MNTTTTTLKSVEELKQAAEAAQAALAEAERAAREEAERARVELAAAAEREKREAMRDAPIPPSLYEQQQRYIAIAEKVRAMMDESLKPITTVSVTDPQKVVEEQDADYGPRVRFIPSRLEVTHRGKPVYCYITFQAEQSSSAYYRRSTTGKLRMSVGDYGERQSFPQRKDGTFDYAAAANHVYSKVRAQESTWQAEAQKQSNFGSVEQLRAEYALSEHTEIVRASRWHRDHTGRSGTEIVAPAGAVLLKLVATATPEQVRAVLDAARKAGIKLS